MHADNLRDNAETGAHDDDEGDVGNFFFFLFGSELPSPITAVNRVDFLTIVQQFSPRRVFGVLSENAKYVQAQNVDFFEPLPCYFCLV